MLQKLRVVAPWIEASDIPIARRWCELEFLIARVYAELRTTGPVNGKGEGKRLVHDYRLLVQTQSMLASQLGLSPAARMTIKANGTRAALDLAAAMAKAGKDVEDADETA
jgi:hypothetical protein